MTKRSISTTFLLWATLFIYSNLYSQTDKGQWMIGGDGYIGSLGQGFYINLNPNLAYFFSDNFAAGGKFLFRTATETENSTAFVLGPFARYYIGKRKVRGLGEMSFGVNIRSKEPAVFQFGLGAGIAWFLNDNVSLDVLGIYSENDLNGLTGSRFGVRFGIQTFL